MKSFRFIFIDVDESFTTSATETDVKGYMICRAPKGTTEATLYPYGNEKTINAMIGLQTANWPDIYEAIQFNTYYDLYISAPPGTAENYPSYYGGVYLTTKGIYDYWRVDDKDEPSYEIQLYPGYEPSKYDSSIEASELSVQLADAKTGRGYIVIKNVDATIVQKMSYINMTMWADSATGFSEGDEVALHLVDGLIYAVVDDEDYTDAAFGFYAMATDGTYTFVLGAASGDVDTETYETNTISSSKEGVPCINLMKILNIDWTTLGTTSGETLDISNICFHTTSTSTSTGTALIEYLALNGLTSNEYLYSDASSVDSKVVVAAFSGISGRAFFRVNLKSECFLRISQKSPNETPTSITIENIGYDKYLYDINCKYMTKEAFLYIQEAYTSYANSTDSNKSLDSTIAKFAKDLTSSNADKIFDVISNCDPLKWAGDVNAREHNLYQFDSSTYTFTEVTSEYKTKTIYLAGELINSVSSKSYSVEHLTDTESSSNYSTAENYATVKSVCDYSLWYISSTGTAGKYANTIYQRTSDGTYTQQSDIDYDTITLSCKEEVYPGSYMSGGEWTGSLEEKGVDATGANIYWPNVLSSSDASFIEVTPVHTLAEMDAINDEGFWTATKIVDPIGPAIDSYTFTISGQRTMTNANETNVDAGTLGCAWTTNTLNGDSSTTVESVFAAAINEGIVEAQNNCYDDALIIMECSGQETFKSKLCALRESYRDTSTVISPRIITKSEFSTPSTVTVSNHSKGCAEYIGEFKMYDTYTGKYWWCQPIGDVGVNLGRIMEKKLGGVAPAGTNDSNNLGGQLNRSVLARKWDFSDDALEILDEKGLNPITYDSTNGLMCQSQRTLCSDTGSDWSYLGHSMSFDLCKREIRDNVMVPQAHKRISDYYYEIREAQIKAILDKRTTGKDPIWSYATVDISGQNTDSTKAARKFMILVKVRVYPYSNYVVLTFNNLSQE